MQESQGGTLSPRDLQGEYTAALSRIAGGADPSASDRHQPIYRREPAPTEKQAIKDAADALSALWKLGPKRRLRIPSLSVEDTA